MFRFNLMGFGITAVSFALAYVVRLLLGQSNSEMMLAVLAGGLMFVLDMVYRLRKPDRERGWKHWLSPQGGGWLAFPVWIMGILFVIYGFVELS